MGAITAYLMESGRGHELDLAKGRRKARIGARAGALPREGVEPSGLSTVRAGKLGDGKKAEVRPELNRGFVDAGD